MKIDRQKALAAFENYVKNYDKTDEKVRLKTASARSVSKSQNPPVLPKTR